MTHAGKGLSGWRQAVQHIQYFMASIEQFKSVPALSTTQ